MQVPKLTGIEYLIEEGRGPSLLFSIASLLGTLALIIALFAFGQLRTAIENDLANLVSILAVIAGGTSSWKSWLNYKNGKTPPAQPPAAG